MVTQPRIFKIEWQRVWGSVPGRRQKVLWSVCSALESYFFWPCPLTVIKSTGLIPSLEKEVLAWEPLLQASLKPEPAFASSEGCKLQVVPRVVREVAVEPCPRGHGCDLRTHVHREMQLPSKRRLPQHGLFPLLAGLQGVSVLCNCWLRAQLDHIGAQLTGLRCVIL